MLSEGMVTRGNRDVYVKLVLLVKEESYFGFRVSFDSSCP